jgi:enoyl-CoA hydratase
MNTGELIRTEKKNGIAILTLNTPGGMNILGTGTLQELSVALQGLGKNKQVRVLIITGEKHFSAGADIREMKEKTPEEAGAFSRLGRHVCDQIEDMGKAVIAAVRGFALGGGCEVALACDIRIASENARFGQPELGLGLVPGFGGTERLPRLVGVGKAKELILTGRIIEAREAEAIGLVNRIVTDDELMKIAEEMAGLIVQKSPLAVEISKKLINENQEIKKGLERGVASFSACFTTEDRVEGMNAFFEKRTPKFEGK